MAGKGVISQEYFTLHQLAAYSGLGARFLREALKNPDHPLPHFRPNRKTIIVSRQEFAGWLEHFRVSAGENLERIVDEVMSDFSKTKLEGRRPSKKRRHPST